MDRIRLKVLGLSYSMSQAGAYALILADEQDMHRIPIVIGMPEAQSIAIQLEKMQTQRPLTHDLIKKLADALQVTLKEAFIYRLDSGIFYSELLFEKNTQQIKIDSRRTVLRTLLLLKATVRPKLFTHLLHTKQELKHREAAHQEDDEHGHDDKKEKEFEHK